MHRLGLLLLCTSAGGGFWPFRVFRLGGRLTVKWSLFCTQKEELRPLSGQVTAVVADRVQRELLFVEPSVFS